MSDSENIVLKLGTIIRIIASSNEELHENMFMINYLDDQIVELIGPNIDEPLVLNTEKNGYFRDKSIESIEILSYNDEDRFLYLYSTYLRRVSNLNLSEVERWSIDFPRWCLLQLKKQLVVNNDYIQRQKMEKDIREINNAEKRNMEIEAFHSLPAIDFDWIARVARGDVTNARALPMSSSSYDAFLAKSTQSFNSFLRFLATRICDKVQLTELGQRKGNPAFISFSSISVMEGKTILTYCGSLLRVAGLPHLQEACTGMKKRVNKNIFKNSIVDYYHIIVQLKK